MLSLFTACVFFSRYRTDSQTRQTIRQSIDRHTDRQLDSRQTDRQSDSRQQTETNGLVWVSDWGRVFFFSPNHCEFLISVITHDYTCNERKLGGRFPQCFLLFFFSLLPVCLSLHHLLLLKCTIVYLGSYIHIIFFCSHCLLEFTSTRSFTLSPPFESTPSFAVSPTQTLLLTFKLSPHKENNEAVKRFLALGKRCPRSGPPSAA